MAAMFSVLLEAAINKWKTLPETVTDLTGRTVIVTGSNVGLGFEAAKRFYAMNPARLILAVRTITKGEDAKRSILETGKKHAPHGTVDSETNIEVWALDLSSFESVRRFSGRCNAELDRIDILLENAGVQSPEWSVTKDGWEADLQVNVLSTYLLAALLAPLIAKTAKLPMPTHGSTLRPHLVIVTSDTHYFAPFPTRDHSNIIAAMNDKSLYVQSDRYFDTKTVEIFVTEELARIPLLKDVVVCSVNPGFCRSEFLREMPTVFRTIMYTLFARTTEEGSKTYTWASLTDSIPAGAYVSSCAVTPAGGAVASKDAGRIRSQLWREVTAILVKEAPETDDILKI